MFLCVYLYVTIIAPPYFIAEGFFVERDNILRVNHYRKQVLSYKLVKAFLYIVLEFCNRFLFFILDNPLQYQNWVFSSICSSRKNNYGNKQLQLQMIAEHGCMVLRSPKTLKSENNKKKNSTAVTKCGIVTIVLLSLPRSLCQGRYIKKN